MSISVVLPELGESVVEGTISQWLVKEGEAVAQDQPLVEVTTDKVDAEIPAPAAGVLEKIVAAEGETVPVGGVLAQIDPDGKGAKSGKASASASAPQASSAPAESAPEAAAAAPAPASTPARSGEEVRATPVARKMAAEAEVDLGGVAGSGPSGRVMKRDVPADSPAAAPAAPPQQASSAPRARPPYAQYALQEGDEIIPMSPLRKLVAEHMVYSKQTSPHVGTVAEIDMGAVSRFRDGHKREFEAQNGFGLTFLPFIVWATVRALRENPALNASVIDDAIVRKKDINIGIAVETDKGLMVPVVRQADRFALGGLAAAIEDVGSRARNKKISPDELRGGSFTVSNPGRQGNLYGFAIINQPQVGILRMGEIKKRAVVRTVDGEDVIVIRPTMHLALSYDHRAVDGAPANSFLHRIRELLEAGEFTL